MKRGSILTGSGKKGDKQINEHALPEVSRYEQIALDIATKIVRGQYRQGEKLFGRSALAGQYNVSPETIRRAVALLHSMDVVVPMPGRGIMVGSPEAGEAFIKEFKHRHHIQDMCNRLIKLVDERNRLNEEIDNILAALISYVTRTAGRLQNIEEIQVPRGSCLVNKSLSEADLRAKTGITVLAIERNGEQIFSPDSTFVIQEGDILIFVGSPDSKDKINRIFYED